MNVYTSSDFKGHYPVGTAAVIVAKDARHAHRLLVKQAEKCGLDLTEHGDFTVTQLNTKTPDCLILNDGNY